MWGDGGGTSDPYVIVTLGDQTFKTRTVYTPPTVDNDPYAYGMARPYLRHIWIVPTNTVTDFCGEGCLTRTLLSRWETRRLRRERFLPLRTS